MTARGPSPPRRSRCRYRLETLAATAVAELRTHELGHFEGSETGQLTPALEFFVRGDAAAVALEADALLPSGHPALQDDGSPTGHAGLPIAVGFATEAVGFVA